MKTPKAKKLPSGNWRVQLQIDGKRYSCTGTSKKEAENAAKKLYAGFQIEKKSVLTVGKAIDKYIDAKEKVLSPSTVRGYKTIRKNHLQSLMDINLTELTPLDIQQAISADQASGKSAKTIKNAHGLLSAMLKEFRPNFVSNPKLPQKKPQEVRIFSEEEMKKVWAASKGTPYELPILLASWLGLRQSEIKGLRFSDIQDGRLHIQRAIVKGTNGPVVKGTKTVSGDRWIKLPNVINTLVQEEWAKLEERGVRPDMENYYICPMSASAIYENFIRICEKAGVKPCRFHDLRHFAASEAHSLGVPDKYAMRRMGHATDNMLKTVYQHTMRDKEDQFADVIDEHMEELFKQS